MMAGRGEPGDGERRAELPQIAGYRIEGVLGRGATGVVYRAVQLSVEREVALKVLHPFATTKESTVRRLRREARLMAMLDHPNIVAAIDVGRSAAGWWMSMDLVEGQALSERLRRGGPMKEEEALRLFIPIAAALQHAHEAGVIHRDVKPANILVTPEGEPRLVDLGLARAEDEPQLTRVGATMGTPHYVSPEQARNPADVDARSDVYSLAATLHHALCGAPPFPGESTAEVIASVMHDPVGDPRELRPGLSRGASLVLRKALSKDRARRHASAREFAADLGLVLKGKKPLVRAADLDPMAGAGGVRRRVLVLGAAVAVVASVGVGIALRGGQELENQPAAAVVRTDLDEFEGRWREGDWVLAEAFASHASLIPGAAERLRHERLGAEMGVELEAELFVLISGVDAVRPTLLHDRRFDEAREALDAGFASALMEATGFVVRDLPQARRSGVEHWLAEAEAEIAAAVERVHAEAAEALARWFEEVLWRRAAALVESGAFEEARELLGHEVIDHLDEAVAGGGGLERTRVARAPELRAVGERLVRERYGVQQAWRELDEGILAGVRERSRRAIEGLRIGVLATASADFVAWAYGRFEAEGLDLDALPSSFSSRASEEFESRLAQMKRLEEDLRVRQELGVMARIDDGAQALREERRHAELVEYWREQREGVGLGLLAFVDLRISEAVLLAGLFEDARARVIAGEERAFELREGGSLYSSVARLDGDPAYGRFWITVAPGVERAWRLGGPARVVDGVRRVSLATLEDLAARREPSLELGLLRLAEGDVAGAEECYRGLDAGDAATRLGNELADRLAPLVAAAARSAAQRAEFARYWVDSRKVEGRSEGNRQKAVRAIERFLRDYGDELDADRRAQVRSWKEELEQELRPSTVSDFEVAFRADTTHFPRRGRVELVQRFDAQTEGAWDAGEWIFTGTRWEGTRLSGVAEVLDAKAPTLLLVEPFALDAGPITVEFELEVPQDARARLVVVSVLGLHCAFVTSAAAKGRVVAGSVDMAGVVERALAGEGGEFAGLRPGQTHRIRLHANRARGTMTVLFDGVECVRIEDISPVGRARSTSVSVRSLEPLVLLEVRIEAPRR
jgi:serine/threonine-protein kinase